jgi:putative ABC transport system substrate-binding protein
LSPSLAHPGGNITGFAQYEYTIGGKWFELLRQVAPDIARVAVLMNASNPASRQHLHAIESAAGSAGVQVKPLAVRAADEFEGGIDEFARGPNGGLIVLPGAVQIVNREQIVRLAGHHDLPAIYPTRDIAASGGLISYGLDPVDQSYRAASYVDRILKGEKPGDLPVQAPTKYELVINLKTAKALALTVPLSLLGRADEVIE